MIIDDKIYILDKRFVDKIKSIVAYRIRVLVTLSKDDLPNCKVCAKIKSV